MGRIYIHLKKKILPNRWAKLYMNDEEDKPGRVQLWKEMHEKYEKSLENYAKQFREEEDDYDDFDYFVAREEGRHIEPKLKHSKVETHQFETVDVKDQIKSVDITDQVGDYFNRPGAKEAMMNAAMGRRDDYNYDEYEEWDEEEYEEYEHSERNDYYEEEDGHTDDL